MIVSNHKDVQKNDRNLHLNLRRRQKSLHIARSPGSQPGCSSETREAPHPCLPPSDSGRGGNLWHGGSPWPPRGTPRARPPSSSPPASATRPRRACAPPPAGAPATCPPRPRPCQASGGASPCLSDGPEVQSELRDISVFVIVFLLLFKTTIAYWRTYRGLKGVLKHRALHWLLGDRLHPCKGNISFQKDERVIFFWLTQNIPCVWRKYVFSRTPAASIYMYMYVFFSTHLKLGWLFPF